MHVSSRNLDKVVVMVNFQRFLLAVITYSLCSATLAADFSIRAWSNDVKIFRNQVLEAVAGQYKGQDCGDRYDVYFGALFSKLSEIKAIINSKSYLLLRDSILTTAADVTPWDEQLSCSIIDRWTLLESLILNELELIGNVLLIIE